ncbi:MAG: PhnA domain-containing protein [Pseudomonadota bacterium]|nr:PhnA domain-containing protein [Pseudomonadota bacterium]
MSDALAPLLHARAHSHCELCGADPDLTVHLVPPVAEAVADRAVLVCATCRAQLDGEVPLAANHWHCLREAVWSEVPAVQVVSWRLLSRLGSEPWATELLDQVFLDDDVLAWAQAGLDATAEGEAAVRVVDSNGAVLADGDAVTLIKDLDVKGASFTAKRGTLVKGIRLTDDPDLVEGKVNGIGIYLKTCFLKKAV